MIQLRNLAHRSIDVVSDRVDHIVTGLERDERSAVIPEGIQKLDSLSSVKQLGDLNVEEGFDNGGFAFRDFSYTGVPLLDSFYFQYTSKDHHLTQILIRPDAEPNRMQLGFHDKNSDDDYYFKVMHRMVADPRVQRFSRGLDLCTGSCTREITKPEGDFVFVLTGFQLSFTGGRDHHINQVGILETDGNLTVRFNDKNFDDNFVWSVQYAYLPRDLFVTTGSSSGSGDQGGARRFVPSGPSVIRGFRFDFQDSDHHVRDIGVTTPDDGRIEVFYEDKNGDDAFDWIVRWGVLSS
jgi:hypothetical protein